MNELMTLWRETMLLQIRYREKINQKTIAGVLLAHDLEEEVGTPEHLRVPEADHPLYQKFEGFLAEQLAEVSPEFSQEEALEFVLNTLKNWNA